MKFNRKYISFIFLLLVCLISIPRDWGHDCHDSQVELANDGDEQVSEHCHICNLDFNTLEIQGFQQPAPSGYSYCIENTEPIAYISIIGIYLDLNKAPPALSC